MKKAILTLSFFVCGAFADNFLLDSLKPIGSHEPMGHEEVKTNSKSASTFVDIDPNSEIGQLVHLLLLERQAKVQQQKAMATKPKPVVKKKSIVKKKVVKKLDPCEAVPCDPAKPKEVVLESGSKEPTMPKDAHAPVAEKKEEKTHEATPAAEKHEVPKTEKKEAPKHGADAAQTIEADASAKRLLAANLCD